MTTQAIGRRITISRDFYGITVEIKSPLHIFPLIFLPIWLCGWAFGVIMVTKSLITGQAPLFVIVWLVGWLCGGGFLLYSWLWLAFGKEIITIESKTLTMKRDILGLGITRATPIRKSSNLRVSQQPWKMSRHQENRAQYGLNGEMIAIDWGGEAHRFGIQLDTREAKAIVRELQSYFPEENPRQDEHH